MLTCKKNLALLLIPLTPFWSGSSLSLCWTILHAQGILGRASGGPDLSPARLFEEILFAKTNLKYKRAVLLGHLLLETLNTEKHSL